MSKSLTNLSGFKKSLLIAFLISLFAVGAYAGTTDNLGLSSTWTTISGWFSDGYAMKIVASIFFFIGIRFAIQGDWTKFFIMLGFSVVIINGATVVGKIATATF